MFLAKAVKGEKVVFSLEQPGENLHKHHQRMRYQDIG